MKRTIFLTVFMLFLGMIMQFLPLTAHAYSHLYPQIRYQDAASSALGGVTLPLTDSVVGNLMNNPAALSKYGSFQAEFFNLQLDANSNSLANIGQNTLSQMSMNSFAKHLNENASKPFGLGASVSAGVAWHGFGFGILTQERVRAVSDGTTIHYDAVSQTIPTAAASVPLARGIVRLGYSFQYVNQTSGKSTTNATAGPYGYMYKLSEGHAFSNNASVNFVFPFTYLPTISLMARNIFGLHYFSGSLFSRASGSTSLPPDEPMVLDAAVNYTIRVSGTMKTNWYFQFQDPFQTTAEPIMDRLKFGAELELNKSFALRVGLAGLNFTAGFGYRSEVSDINLAMYSEKNPLPLGAAYDTRWVLQYVLKFKDRPTRDRTKEK